jgi:hypothetical protein
MAEPGKKLRDAIAVPSLGELGGPVNNAPPITPLHYGCSSHICPCPASHCRAEGYWVRSVKSRSSNDRTLALQADESSLLARLPEHSDRSIKREPGGVTTPLTHSVIGDLGPEWLARGAIGHLPPVSPARGCPACGHRCGAIYCLPRGHFRSHGMIWACRRCQRLVYPSQREGKGERALRRLRTVLRRAGEPGVRTACPGIDRRGCIGKHFVD